MKKIYFLICVFVICVNIFYTNEIYAQEKPDSVTNETIEVGSKTLKYREERADNYSKGIIIIPSTSLDNAYNILKEYYNTNNRQDVYYKIGRLVEIFGQLNPVKNNDNNVIDMSIATILMYKSSDKELIFDMQDSETGSLWSYNIKYEDGKAILTIVYTD
ncbi:hypothetical protein [uncultured Brachyspira sp.]|uniref:hypothetical protein n=1 Tax=uncultured Brachyspira sp. TaxID=221953 RepID=UPI00262AD374|nr:hypothetical protein [uncultured Brachyspira sp.]